MTPCAACGSEARVPRLRKETFMYAGCTGCGLLSLEPVPPAAAAAPLYDETYFRGQSGIGGYSDYAADEELHRRNARQRLLRLETAGSRPPGTLLEIGSAAGFLLDEARRRGWTARGVDVSPWARREAKARFGFDLSETVGAALSGAPEGIHAAVALQVLEHVPDPGDMLGAIRSAMRPGGHVLVETWDAGAWISRLMGSRWQQVTPPSVIHLFDRTSLRRLFARAGFRVERIETVSKSVNLKLVLGQIGEKIPAVRSAAGGAGFPEIALPYRLGDLILVIARTEGTSGG